MKAIHLITKLGYSFDELNRSDKLRIANNETNCFVTLEWLKVKNILGNTIDQSVQIYINRHGSAKLVENGNITNYVSSPYPEKSDEIKMMRELGKCPEARKQIYSLLENTDKRIKYFLPIKKGSGRITQTMIDNAKDYPVEHLLGFDNRNTTTCIWGEHRNARLSKPSNKNFVKCFACDRSADSIEIYKTLNNCDFKTAVKQMQQ